METPLCPLRIHHNSELVAHLLEKKKLLEAHDPAHKKFKTTLVLEGGIMFGIYGMGVLAGLEKLGFTEIFDYVVGGSAGAGIGAYFLAEKSKLGEALFYEDMTNSNFINPLRLTKVLNLDYVEDVFRYKKPLAVDRIRKSRSELLISVTDMATGKGAMISSKDESIDLITALKASMSVPVLYKKGVVINGKHYCDGIIGLPNAIEYAARILKSTDILVITNRSCECQSETPLPPLTERLLVRTLLRKDTLGFKQAFVNREPHYRHDMGLLWGEEPLVNFTVGLICRNHMPISRFSRNKKKLEQVAKDAEEQTVRIFAD